MAQKRIYKAGLDIGSTTAKIILLDSQGSAVFSDYRRHHADIGKTVDQFLNRISEMDPGCYLDLRLTGSAALDTAEKLSLPFVQEVVAMHGVVQKRYPEIRTAVDIGGEDSKMVFFNPGRPPDIRMNGSCAGGTGSFIDQMADLMGLSPLKLNLLAAEGRRIHPVASRCGVFAKTDVQNMLSRNVPHADIAASIFHAVAVQCINALARGQEIRPRILLCGGVFSFLPELAAHFLQVLNFSRSDLLIPEHSELIPATGAALFDRTGQAGVSISRLRSELNRVTAPAGFVKKRLEPLFESDAAYDKWKRRSGPIDVPSVRIEAYPGETCFIGIDSGSTTTKIIAIGEERQVLFSWYQNNSGHPVETVAKGLDAFRTALEDAGKPLVIARTAVTGYGEDLIRAAFSIDDGIVETLAHKTAASFIDPKVSFILDIGGQDMKAMFVENGKISRIEVNEACSSGCGSFLETFAGGLGHTIREFGQMACQAKAPCDLGTRCTVFMNSKVKQSLRENASKADISAGLAYSVIKNCLFKVLKLHDMSVLGNHIVVQGGAFKNPSILRAMEVLTGCSVKTSTMPELMGAFGAGLAAAFAHERHPEKRSVFQGLADPGFQDPESQDQDHQDQVRAGKYKTKQMVCKGCENTCQITRFDFFNQNTFFSGNKCEAHFSPGFSPGFSSQDRSGKKGFDFIAYKSGLVFDHPMPTKDRSSIILGIPRVLGFFDHYPFWHALFSHCGLGLVLSPPSTVEISEKAMGTVMSDNICFPAKLVHGHIDHLAQNGADRIFFPIVVYEQNEYEYALNSYNCPLVSSYADVIESAVNPLKRWGVPLDRPVINFADLKLLTRACYEYLRLFNIKKSVVKKGVQAGMKAYRDFKEQMQEKSAQLVRQAIADQSLLIVIASRPYHADSLINHKLPAMLGRMGIDTITEDAVPVLKTGLDNVRVITQWAWPNRIFNAASWVAKQPENIQMVQINSFGCGPDAIVVDEVKALLNRYGKNQTLIKVDEISSPGSVRLRLRSMVESLKEGAGSGRSETAVPRPHVRFSKKDRERTIWVPFFAEDYSDYIPYVFKNAGYDFKVLPKPDRRSVELGLQYATNDICYPGTLVIGDILKALKTERYHPGKIAVGITQTGGQCRASSYFSLIQKSVVKAGYGDIPILSVTSNPAKLDQPGFVINWLKKMKILFMATMYADCIAKMYYSTAPREVHKGRAEKVRAYFTQKVGPAIISSDYFKLFRLLNQAVEEFNTIAVHHRQCPRIGVVGEIYVKYNYFASQNLIHRLIDNGVEPVLPPIIDFFIQDLVNYRENIKARVRRRKVSDLLGIYLEMKLKNYQQQINKVFSRFRYAVPFEDISQVAKKASDILTMTNQFGEGWLIPGEIAMFSAQGVKSVISVQPFGCIANHIVSKGVEKRIKDLYPDMKLHFLDFDAGMSEANVINRLHFMIETA